MNRMPWLYLTVAGLLEIAWLYTMKRSDGFSRLGWTLATAALMLSSFTLLSQAIRTLPVGTAYAVWTGIGAVGAAAIGILFFDEPRSAMRLVSIALVIAGIVGLKLAG